MYILFWCSLGLILYTLLGYPFFLFFITKLIRESKENLDSIKIDYPKVSLIVAAYNEETFIGDKIENTLQLDYPHDNLEMIVVSDGSTDRTDEIVKRYEKYGVRLHRIPKREGKVAGHRSVLKVAKGEIIVFSDATTMYERSAIKDLTKHFAEADIGCVGGALKYKKPTQSIHSVNEQPYWSYETFIRKLESQADSIPAVSGAIYALRRELYAGFPKYLADDLINPLHVRRLGYHTIFEPKAVCWDTSSKNLREEFRKRRRIAAQNVGGLIYMRSLLNPLRYPKFSWILFSHKVLRLVLPFFLVILLFSGLGAFGHRLAPMGISIIMLFLLGICFTGWFLELIGKASRVFSLPLYFVVSNFGVIAGLIEALIGKQYATWQSERYPISP